MSTIYIGKWHQQTNTKEKNNLKMYNGIQNIIIYKTEKTRTNLFNHSPIVDHLKEGTSIR